MQTQTVRKGALVQDIYFETDTMFHGSQTHQNTPKEVQAIIDLVKERSHQYQMYFMNDTIVVVGVPLDVSDALSNTIFNAITAYCGNGEYSVGAGAGGKYHWAQSD